MEKTEVDAGRHRHTRVHGWQSAGRLRGRLQIKSLRGHAGSCQAIKRTVDYNTCLLCKHGRFHTQKRYFIEISELVWRYHHRSAALIATQLCKWRRDQTGV